DRHRDRSHAALFTHATAQPGAIAAVLERIRSIWPNQGGAERIRPAFRKRAPATERAAPSWHIGRARGEFRGRRTVLPRGLGANTHAPTDLVRAGDDQNVRGWRSGPCGYGKAVARNGARRTLHSGTVSLRLGQSLA